MLRRTALEALLGASLPADSRGAALLMPAGSRKPAVIEGGELARRWILPPGSTLKPFTLQALLECGKLDAAEEYLCPGNLIIAGRSLACSHPPAAVPLRVVEAIAYSCNCFVASFARRFGPGELARHLVRAGFAADRVRPAATPDAAQLQALGEAGVLVTPLELLLAYDRLARAATAPIRDGLEGAVAYGTAQRARLPGITAAGKTGSIRTMTGAYAAWFAGFAPSRSPEAVVTVVVQGRSGGADAAPVAGRMLAAWLRRRP